MTGFVGFAGLGVVNLSDVSSLAETQEAWLVFGVEGLAGGTVI
jgi:hypothetical protein